MIAAIVLAICVIVGFFMIVTSFVIAVTAGGELIACGDFDGPIVFALVFSAAMSISVFFVGSFAGIALMEILK